MWFTPLIYRIVVDVESKPGSSQVCVIPMHVKIGAGIHIPYPNTTNSHTHKHYHSSNNTPNKTDKNKHILQINIYSTNNNHKEHTLKDIITVQDKHTIPTIHSNCVFVSVRDQ